MKTISKQKIGKVAVVGMSGIFPQAFNTDTFLQNILNKQNAITTVPDHRWGVPVDDFISTRSVEDKATSKKAGLIENFNFDPTGFLIDKDLLAQLDPVHQLVLQAGREAYLQCAHSQDAKKQTGVILAAIALPTQACVDFSSQILLNETPFHVRPQDYSRTSMVSFPAAVLARALGFEAGSFTLDAACASSLYSIKLACEQLHLKKADIMVAGGVSRPSSLYTQIGFSQLQALSPTGTCSPFDQHANGLVVGEGTGIVVLKRLEDAISQGDTIHAVISGAGVSNDIDGTLVGPASEGQQRAMLQAYDHAGWSINDIQYMECHGSGTPVGDQVELTSIKTLLDQFECPDKDLRIGSVKSMIGHLLTAAGAAGFIKTILSMNKQVLPPSLNFSGPSEKSILNQSRIKVQTDCENWDPKNTNTSRKAGVSAFGFGGINAHLLVEEFKSTASQHFIPQAQKLTMVPCAIVGMETITKECESLDQFSDLVFGHSQLTAEDSRKRWRRPVGDDAIKGYFIHELETQIGEFHIPPNQMDDILPQHIFLLKAAIGALTDANISPRPLDTDPIRNDMGCAIGIDFDYGAADFNLRWQLNALDTQFKNSVSNPLTFNRTLGALGGIVASRVAREFKLGGPCFTLSANMASGMKAIETAIHSLSANETRLFLCGCVDLAGDLRQLLLNTHAKSLNQTISPSEGSAAIVLKRLDQAIEDNDKIYGVVSGMGSASGGIVPGEKSGKNSEGIQAENQTDIKTNRYISSLNKALDTANCQFDEIDLYEACLSGVATDDQTEALALNQICQSNRLSDKALITATTPTIGNTYGNSSLLSVIKTALCLYKNKRPKTLGRSKTFFDEPIIDQAPDLKSGDSHNVKKACAASITLDGGYSHLILESHDSDDQPSENTSIRHQQRDKTATNQIAGQFIVRTNPHPITQETLSAIQIELPSLPLLQMNETFSQTGLGSISSSTNISMNEMSAAFDPGLIAKATQATAQAHKKFLKFSQTSMENIEHQFEQLTQVASEVIANNPGTPINTEEPVKESEPDNVPLNPVFLNREQCLEYAVGKAGNVLGPEFDIIDTYPVRVRLPAEPLMLVDRIMDIQGEMLSLGPGKIITQHDVKENAWYLDGGKTPVSISIEAGQADLFLCAWLGIDHVVKGSRKYRLLDARVTFHRTLPEPGETIEYHIEIERFLKQGDVYLFFFHYKGYINDQLLISMRDGCAGFFTEQEVENSGGIILKKEDLEKIEPSAPFHPLLPVKKEAYSDDQIESLRSGDLQTAFGPDFSGITLGNNMLLPDGRMHLLDRVLEFDPQGGRFGMGSIIAQADIHPDDWFLTCHFIDDMVMPGTLMYDCCAHALRIFTQRMGWISTRDDVYYDVVSNNESDLKCRGPVTRETKKARYEIEIKEMGYNPEPYIIADAHMFSDDQRIVLYKDMGIKMIGLSKAELEGFWNKQ